VPRFGPEAHPSGSERFDSEVDNMDPHGTMQEILATARKLGVQSTAAGFTKLRERMVRFSNNSITVTNTWQTEVPTVYLISGKKRAACHVEEQNPQALRDAIEELVKTMKVTPEGDVNFELPTGPFKYQSIPRRYDRKLANAEAELVDAVETGINAAKEEGALRVSGVIISQAWEHHVLTSAGAGGSDRGTTVQMTTRAFASDEASGQGLSLSTTLRQFNPEDAGRNAGQLAKMALNPEPGQPGKYNVVFGPSIFANLLNRVADSASAYTVDLGMSFFGNMLGKRVASENFTLHDNSRLPNGPGSISLDDEGYPTQDIAIVEHGLLRTYLHTSYTAAKYKSSLTGNARFEGGMAGMTAAARNIVVEQGEKSLEDLFETANQGLYITNNWYTRFQNFQTGDFSTICRDGIFLIKNGRLAGPVKGLRVSDNMVRILQSVKALSKDRHWVKWWEVETPTLTPYALVEGVGITTANK
jgi:PmbA protein